MGLVVAAHGDAGVGDLEHDVAAWVRDRDGGPVFATRLAGVGERKEAVAPLTPFRTPAPCPTMVSKPALELPSSKAVSMHISGLE